MARRPIRQANGLNAIRTLRTVNQLMVFAFPRSCASPVPTALLSDRLGGTCTAAITRLSIQQRQHRPPLVETTKHPGPPHTTAERHQSCVTAFRTLAATRVQSQPAKPSQLEC